MPDNNNILSGTATAVIIGFASILAALLGGDFFSMGERMIMFLMGSFFAWAGVKFSKG